MTDFFPSFFNGHYIYFCTYFSFISYIFFSVSVLVSNTSIGLNCISGTILVMISFAYKNRSRMLNYYFDASYHEHQYASPIFSITSFLAFSLFISPRFSGHEFLNYYFLGRYCTREFHMGNLCCSCFIYIFRM